MSNPAADFVTAVSAYVENLAAQNREKLGVHRECHVGKTTLGKRRVCDLFLTNEHNALIVECKNQNVSGSAEEKLIYALEDLRRAPLPGILVYGGEGFSDGIRAHLKTQQDACEFHLNQKNWELSHAIAAIFGWYSVFLC